MLNLKELEKKLDNALSKETEQSLSEWLLIKRYRNSMRLGEGTYENLVVRHTIIHTSSIVFYNSPRFTQVEEVSSYMASSKVTMAA